ncbi:MAG: preprotein translocase subunit SecG [Hyphomicrobiales bacterium]
MAAVVLVVHLLVAIALIGVVLLQRSEGGALGIGGGGGGSLFSSRGTANVLTRATAFLAAAFFMTSILLTILNHPATQPTSIFDQVAPTAPAKAPGADGGSVLPKLPDAAPPASTAPSTAPAAPAAPAAPTTPQVPQ